MSLELRYWILAAALAGSGGALSSTLPEEPLDPEKAFPASARAVPGTGVEINFRILDGYYLYRDRFRVSVEPAGLPLGAIVAPAGERKDDPFIGPTEILKRSARVQVPFTGSAKPGSYLLKVTAQGCAEDRVCYAPFTQLLRVSIP
jgi:thiol:disulfide interchange protein DsbD